MSAHEHVTDFIARILRVISKSESKTLKATLFPEDVDENKLTPDGKATARKPKKYYTGRRTRRRGGAAKNKDSDGEDDNDDDEKKKQKDAVNRNSEDEKRKKTLLNVSMGIAKDLYLHYKAPFKGKDKVLVESTNLEPNVRAVMGLSQYSELKSAPDTAVYQSKPVSSITWKVVKFDDDDTMVAEDMLRVDKPKQIRYEELVPTAAAAAAEPKKKEGDDKQKKQKENEKPAAAADDEASPSPSPSCSVPTTPKASSAEDS